MKKTLVIAICLPLSLLACSKPAEQPSEPEPTVKGQTIVFPPGNHETESIRSLVVKRQVAPATRLNGRLTWDEDRTVRIYTPFAGRVEKILAQPGETVKAGEALAVIASPEFGQAQADARLAESNFALALKNRIRAHELVQHGVAARKELQTAEADYSRAKAELDRTRRRLALYGDRRDNIDQTFTLRSPIAGVVVQKNINPGQELRPDQMTSNAPPIYVITDPGTLWAIIDASEKDLSRLRVGKVIAVHSPAYRNETFAATVTAIADYLDPVTRMIKVRAVIDNGSRKLKSDMFVTAEVDADGEMIMLIPAKAVFFQGGHNYVFTEESKDHYQRREVQTDDVYGDEVEIAAGLNEGQKVVTTGSLMLQQIIAPRRIQK